MALPACRSQTLASNRFKGRFGHPLCRINADVELRHECSAAVTARLLQYTERSHCASRRRALPHGAAERRTDQIGGITIPKVPPFISQQPRRLTTASCEAAFWAVAGVAATAIHCRIRIWFSLVTFDDTDLSSSLILKTTEILRPQSGSTDAKPANFALFTGRFTTSNGFVDLSQAW